jgi:hypothetical protein
MVRATSAEVISVFIVRAWREDQEFRARLTYTSNVATHEENVRYVGSKVEVNDAVLRWLDSL